MEGSSIEALALSINMIHLFGLDNLPPFQCGDPERFMVSMEGEYKQNRSTVQILNQYDGIE